MSSPPASLRALLSDLIDYAGLFPPAALPMQQAVENYARYLAGPEAWALARFVVPVARFAEFESAMLSLRTIEPWCISALLGAKPEADLEEIDRFNDRNRGRAVVDAVEVKASTAEEIAHIRAYVRIEIPCYFEIAPQRAAELLSTIRAIHGRAKIRTGGVSPEAIPTTDDVANFIVECARHDVPFKATAGLHHPVRCIKPLTYQPDAPAAMMHGFLNVFLAAVAARNGAMANELNTLLSHQCISGFVFEDTGLYWQSQSFTTTQIDAARHEFAISFGSCSFEEPLADLRELKLL